jgi:metal-responsive CopG/Arc/MetJ family transcriptional regulator
MGRRQSLVQLSDELIALLDERAARSGRSRSALIREAVEFYLAADAEAAVDAAIAEAYERRPQEPDRWAEVAARNAIAAEPW